MTAIDSRATDWPKVDILRPESQHNKNVNANEPVDVPLTLPAIYSNSNGFLNLIFIYWILWLAFGGVKWRFRPPYIDWVQTNAKGHSNAMKTKQKHFPIEWNLEICRTNAFGDQLIAVEQWPWASRVYTKKKKQIWLLICALLIFESFDLWVCVCRVLRQARTQSQRPVACVCVLAIAFLPQFHLNKFNF